MGRVCLSRQCPREVEGEVVNRGGQAPSGEGGGAGPAPGRRTSRPVDFLLVGLLLHAIAAGVACGEGSTSKSGQIAYAPPGRADLYAEELRTYGLLAKGEGLGPITDVRVSEKLVVTDVPESFIRACLAYVRIVLAASEALPQDEKADQEAVARALARWWVYSTPEGVHALRAKKDEKSMEEQMVLLEQNQREIERSIGLVYPMFKGTISAEWLFCHRLGHPPLAKRRARRAQVRFTDLLSRFDPARAASREDAYAVAEELIWTQQLGLSDGTIASLPAARIALQAFILEALGYDVGDPTDPNESKRRLALRRLEEAKRALNKGTVGDGTRGDD